MTNKPKFTPSQLAAQRAVETVMAELNKPVKTKSRSRVWEATNGYIHLIVWSNASLLRVMGVKWWEWIKGIYGRLRETEGKTRSEFLKSLNYPLMSPKGFHYISRLEGQWLDELRSIVANIEEGFARPTTKEYLDFLGYSQASLKEAKGDVQRFRQDSILESRSGSSVNDLGIDFRNWHEALKQSVISKPFKGDYPPAAPKRSIGGRGGDLREIKGTINSSRLKSPKIPLKSLNTFRFNYKPVDDLDPRALTYEMFIELINKTDYTMRKLVESLETKLTDNRQAYQVERARIRGNVGGWR